jgi:methionine aminopeptidase
VKIVEDAMTDALARLRAGVTRDDVLRAIQEYDRLGPERFFSEHGFGPSRSYELGRTPLPAQSDLGHSL